MDLYILRHAIAEPKTGAFPRGDRQRKLTVEGSRRMRRIARGMKTAGLSFDVILTSPYVRARQTADIVAGVFGLEKQVELTAALAPGGIPVELIELLNRDYAARKSILLVGHEPGLSRLISVLLTGGPDLSLNLKKGGLCRLTVAHPRAGCRATLEFLLAPAQSRRLA